MGRARALANGFERDAFDARVYRENLCLRRTSASVIELPAKENLASPATRVTRCEFRARRPRELRTSKRGLRSSVAASNDERVRGEQLFEISKQTLGIRFGKRVSLFSSGQRLSTCFHRPSRFVSTRSVHRDGNFLSSTVFVTFIG